MSRKTRRGRTSPFYIPTCIDDVLPLAVQVLGIRAQSRLFLFRGVPFFTQPNHKSVTSHFLPSGSITPCSCPPNFLSSLASHCSSVLCTASTSHACLPFCAYPCLTSPCLSPLPSSPMPLTLRPSPPTDPSHVSQAPLSPLSPPISTRSMGWKPSS